MKHLICSAVLLFGAQVPAWAEENAGVPTPEQLAEEEKKMNAEEEQSRRGSPLVVYDKRGGPIQSADAQKAERTAARGPNAKGFNFNTPSGGGAGAGGGVSGSGGRGLGSVASPTTSGALPGSGMPTAGGPGKNKDGPCQSAGYRENAKSSGIEYARLQCQKQQLKDNKQLRKGTAFALAPIVPAPILKDQMDKLK